MSVPVDFPPEDEEEELEEEEDEMSESETGDMSEEGYAVEDGDIRPVYVLSTEDLQVVDANNFMGEDIVDRTFDSEDFSFLTDAGKRRRGRPKGTTAARGYKVSPGRPPGIPYKRVGVTTQLEESTDEQRPSAEAKPDSTTPTRPRGRRKGTTRANGFKVSTGRPRGTTRQAGYKVSTGRPKKKQEAPSPSALPRMMDTSTNRMMDLMVVTQEIKPESSSDCLPKMAHDLPAPDLSISFSDMPH